MDRLALLTPRTGLGQEEFGDFLGGPAVRRIKIDDVIDKSVFEQLVPPDGDVLDFARANKLSLPVRFHDLEEMESRFPIGRYEFHLSFGDVSETIDVSSLSQNNRYSIHLPDYVSPTQLMDPFSPNEAQQQASLHIISRTAELAETLQDMTSAEVPIVGSFSVLHADLDGFYRQHSELLEEYRARGVSILPQWLPPVAWYFGGAVRLHAMNDAADIEHIKSHRLPICMDVCHLCMGDKVFDFKAADVVKDLALHTHHVHLADAGGYDGEGLPFGEGDPENLGAISATMALDCVKVMRSGKATFMGALGLLEPCWTLGGCSVAAYQWPHISSVAAYKQGKTTLILGVTGQDGAHLAADLLSRGWKVHGGFRRGHVTKLWRLEELGILGKLNLVNLNLHEPHQVIEIISQLQPSRLYHFAGESFIADSFQQPRSVIETNTLGTLNVLEAVRIFSPKTRLFFASSAEVFGTPSARDLLDEESPLRPSNPYGISKLSAQQLVGVYRERHGLHAVCGIMFNHEGPLRARNFVTRKITFHLARLRVDGGPPMQLGAFDAARDWGSAVDYSRAVPMTLELDTPRNFVFATGKETTVSDFLRLSAEAAGFSPAFEGEGLSIMCRDAKSGQTLAVVSP